MKVLCERIDSHICRNLVDNLKKIGHIGVIEKIDNIAKALNEYQPDLLILRTENITGVVQAYCQNNNVKLIGFGEGQNADIVFSRSQDVLLPTLDVLSFKDESVDKLDISVFVENENQRLIADFLAKNYNVKIYGPIKINSPKYLGIPTDIEKYEILNKSKFFIDLGTYNSYDAVLLGTYPIIYSNQNMAEEYKTFENLVDLVEIIESLDDNETEDAVRNNLNTLTLEFKKQNSTTFTIDVLKTLGFVSETIKLEENLNDWITC